MAWVKVGNAHYNSAQFERLEPDSVDARYLVAKTGGDDSVRLGPMADATAALAKLTAIVTALDNAVVTVP